MEFFCADGQLGSRRHTGIWQACVLWYMLEFCILLSCLTPYTSPLPRLHDHSHPAATTQGSFITFARADAVLCDFWCMLS